MPFSLSKTRADLKRALKMYMSETFYVDGKYVSDILELLTNIRDNLLNFISFHIIMYFYRSTIYHLPS